MVTRGGNYSNHLRIALEIKQRREFFLLFAGFVSCSSDFSALTRIRNHKENASMSSCMSRKRGNSTQRCLKVFWSTEQDSRNPFFVVNLFFVPCTCCATDQLLPAPDPFFGKDPSIEISSLMQWEIFSCLESLRRTSGRLQFRVKPIIFVMQ